MNQPSTSLAIKYRITMENKLLDIEDEKDIINSTQAGNEDWFLEGEDAEELYVELIDYGIYEWLFILFFYLFYIHLVKDYLI